jgi:VWFA-related protein
MTPRTLAFSLLFLATALFAQQGLPPLVEKVDVTVTNVDVTVLDASGHPVPGLTSKDFQVFEDGKLQSITNFYAVEHAVVREDVAGATASPAPQRFRRKAVLIVDNHFIDKHSRDAALRQVRDFIDADYNGDYDWSLGAISGGVHLIQPFTSDKAVIHASLDRLLGSGVSATIPASAGSAASESSQGLGVTGAAQASFAESAAQLVEMEKNIRFASGLDALRASARAVIDACRAFSSIKGKKLIILVTGSMEVENRVTELRSERFGANPSDNDRDATLIRDAMIREANAANFNVYIVNAAGVATPVVGFDVGNKRPDDAVLGEVRDLDSMGSALASQTGGEYMTSNVVGQSIKTIDDVSATYYSIGYSPKHGEDGKYHRIEVRVANRGYKVLSRAGYLDASDAARLEQSLKVAVSGSVAEGNLPVRVIVGKPAPRGNTQMIPVTTSFPLRLVTTVRQGARSAGRVHVYLSIFDQKDANVAFNHAVQQVDLTDEQLRAIAAAPDSNFRYTMKVDLKPGLYHFVVAVRDEISDEVGKASTTVDTRG